MNSNKILLSHGSGGKLTHTLLNDLVRAHFSNPILNKCDDSAVFNLAGKIAFTTDSFVVNPLFFPGADIGKLAVCGTINDLAVMGAKALYLTCAFIIEEGLDISILERIIKSMKKAANECKVDIVGGDLKVVEINAADKIFINTSGIGLIEKHINISANNAKAGDNIIINGFIADHGAAVMSSRADYKLKTSIKSDCAGLGMLIQEILAVSDKVHVLRDPTRGGVATTLKEIALQSNVGIKIYEDKLPVREEVRAFCDILGIDPLYLACEGKVLIFAEQNETGKILAKMRRNKYGKRARVIGQVVKEHPANVVMHTKIGSSRIIDMLSGEQLPRIC